VSRQSHYRWTWESPAYRDAFAEARDEAVAALETEVHRRAVHGVPRYKYYRGKPLMWTNPETGRREHYSEREYNDRLMIFLLKALDPATYRDPPRVVYVRRAAGGGAPLTLSLDELLAALGPSGRRLLAEKLARAELASVEPVRRRSPG
jgi:hypothetical protein